MATRTEQLRKARNINEIMDIVDQIETEFNKTKKMKVTSSEFSIEVDGNPVNQGSNKKQIKVIKKVSPKMSAIKGPFSVLQKLYDQHEDLYAAIQLVKTNYSGMKNANTALNAITKLFDEVDAKIGDALDEVGKHAEQYMPDELKEIGTKVEQSVLKQLDSDKYTDHGYYVYAAPIDDKGEPKFQFTYYVSLTDLQDDSGYAYKEYLIAISAIVHAKQPVMELYINGLQQFKLPGSFPLGKHIADEKQAVKQARLIMASSHIISDIDRQPIKADPQAIKNRIVDKNVSDVIVKDDAIIVLLKGKLTEDVKNTLITTIWSGLNAAINKAGRSALKYSFKPYRGTQAIEFVLVPQDGNKQVRLNMARLNDLKDMLNLTDDELRALKLALSHRDK